MTPSNRPELLAPAGNPEKLRIALHYGADAVYLGGPAFGLRAQAGNFSLPEIGEAVRYAHGQGARVYLTVNSYLDNRDLPGLKDYLHALAPLALDALIVSDPGVITLCREIVPHLPLHLSTQANTTNWQSARFWGAQGIERVNLARETTLSDIAETVRNAGIETEMFIHGAMCISYSGRCLISNVLTGRDANKGACTHPCRWRYALVEETRPGEYFPVEEGANGTFIFNSRDLCLLEHLPAIVNSGVSSLKIEGRMKGIHYLATVTRVYRAALDRYAADPAGYSLDPVWLDELQTVSNRGYTTGFLFGPPQEVGQEYDCRYHRHYDIVGLVEEVMADGSARVAVRNRMVLNETLEAIGPQPGCHRFTLSDMTDTVTGTPLTGANPNSTVQLRLPYQAAPLDILRRAKQGAES
jgi:U32 family peptidase